MIKEDYVSFEVAKLLKDKGFTQQCPYYYLDGQMFKHCYQEVIPKNKEIVECPTQAMAMKWLREVHYLHIMINCIGKVNYDPIVQSFDGKDFEIDGVEVGITRHVNGKLMNVRRGFKTYEEACEAAIKYCLENLIVNK